MSSGMWPRWNVQTGGGSMKQLFWGFDMLCLFSADYVVVVDPADRQVVSKGMFWQ